MTRTIAATLKTIPVIGPLAKQLYFRFFAPPLASSGAYWEARYQGGGHSGPGSRERLAHFKAEVLNDFVHRNSIRSVIEFGCGDGAQLALTEYPEYVGLDVSKTAVEQCRARFAADASKQFLQSGDELGRTFDLALSLDVIYHLVENGVFESYMHALFKASHRWVIIYSSNCAELTLEPHVRHRNFSDWVARYQRDWTLIEKIKNRYPYDRHDPDHTSFSDFYVYKLVREAPPPSILVE